MVNTFVAQMPPPIYGKVHSRFVEGAYDTVHLEEGGREEVA